MLRLLIIALALFAISPFILGKIIFPERTSQTFANNPVVTKVIASPVPTLTYEKPLSLKIPVINVDSNVEFVALDDKGRMDVPKNDDNVAWWSLGVKPGEVGNAVLAGHFDKKDGGPAVFYDLKSLKKGDEITIVDELGKILTFEVYRTEVFKDEVFPIELVFGGTNERNLNLITCDGTFDINAKNYSDRFVVFSKLRDQISEN